MNMKKVKTTTGTPAHPATPATPTRPSTVEPLELPDPHLSAEEYSIAYVKAGRHGVDTRWRHSLMFHLYIHPGSRYVVMHELHNDYTIGSDRHDQLVARGISPYDKDSADFANAFVERFCDHLSLHDLEILIPALIAERDRQEAERQTALAKGRELYGDGWGAGKDDA